MVRGANADLQFQSVASDLPNPVAITHAGDGSGRLFIALQEGRILIFDGTRILPTPFLDIRSKVSCCGERGLLSVAFHPNYASNGFFFVNYTNIAGHTVVARYKVSEDPNVANYRMRKIILRVRQPFPNHKGGQLQFGPDGFLYIGLGDGGSGGDPGNRAQNRRLLLGKMLRVDVNGRTRYSIPSNNPFLGVSGVKKEIWAMGLRNPWRFSFDRLTGDLYIADVGQNSWEEVNHQPAASLGGENYGWRLMEGNHCFNPASDCNDGTLILPIVEYDHTVGCSVTGGYVYRGSLVPSLFGIYLYGDFCTGVIWGTRFDQATGWTTTVLHDTNFVISTFGENEVGELYVADYAVGTIYRIIGATP
jgi:glucose/arabinose dehydrogenase